MFIEEQVESIKAKLQSCDNCSAECVRDEQESRAQGTGWQWLFVDGFQIWSWTHKKATNILRKEEEVAKNYKHLTELNCFIDWNIYKYKISQLSFVTTFRSFNMSSKMLKIINQSVVAGAIYCATVCLGSSIKDASRLNKLLKAGKIIGQNLETFMTVKDMNLLNKLLSIMDNLSHLLHATKAAKFPYQQTHSAPLPHGTLQAIICRSTVKQLISNRWTPAHWYLYTTPVKILLCNTYTQLSMHSDTIRM